MIWPQTPSAARSAVRLHQLGHARVVVEMARDQGGNVDIAAFTDRLAVVERFQHREQARVFLHQSRQRIEVFRPLMARTFRPGVEGAAGGGNSGVHIIRCGLGQMGQQLAGGGGVLGLKTVAHRAHLAVDERAKGAACAVQPSHRLARAFGGGRAVIHGFEDFFDGHGLPPHGMTVGAEYWPVTWCSSWRSISPSREDAPKRNRSGCSQRSPSSSFIRAR